MLDRLDRTFRVKPHQKLTSWRHLRLTPSQASRSRFWRGSTQRCHRGKYDGSPLQAVQLPCRVLLPVARGHVDCPATIQEFPSVSSDFSNVVTMSGDGPILDAFTFQFDATLRLSLCAGLRLAHVWWCKTVCPVQAFRISDHLCQASINPALRLAPSARTCRRRNGFPPDATYP